MEQYGLANFGYRAGRVINNIRENPKNAILLALAGASFGTFGCLGMSVTPTKYEVEDESSHQADASDMSTSNLETAVWGTAEASIAEEATRAWQSLTPEPSATYEPTQAVSDTVSSDYCCSGNNAMTVLFGSNIMGREEKLEAIIGKSGSPSEARESIFRELGDASRIINSCAGLDQKLSLYLITDKDDWVDFKICGYTKTPIDSQTFKYKECEEAEPVDVKDINGIRMYVFEGGMLDRLRMQGLTCGLYEFADFIGMFENQEGCQSVYEQFMVSIPRGQSPRATNTPVYVLPTPTSPTYVFPTITPQKTREQKERDPSREGTPIPTVVPEPTEGAIQTKPAPQPGPTPTGDMGDIPDTPVPPENTPDDSEPAPGPTRTPGREGQ